MTISDLHRTTTALPQLVSAGLAYRDEHGASIEYAHLDHGATTPAFAAVADEVAAVAAGLAMRAARALPAGIGLGARGRRRLAQRFQPELLGGLERRIAIEDHAIAHADAIIASSRDEAEVQYAGYASYDPGRIRIIPPGSDLGLFAGTCTDPLVDARIEAAADAVALMHACGYERFAVVGVDDVARLHHLAFLHQVLDHVDRAFGHTLREFLDGDGFRQGDFAGNLLARFLRHRPAHLFLTAAHGRQRAATPAFFGGKR